MLHYIRSPLGPIPHKTPTLHPLPLPPLPQILGCPSYNQPWFIQTIIFAKYREPSASTPPTLAFAGTELKDAELIDGTLFIRAAGLTAGRLGWVREGESPTSWDTRGFFNHD